MTKKTKISTDDLAAFEDAAKGTRRYHHNKAQLTPAVKPNKSSRPEIHDAAEYNLDMAVDAGAVSSEEYISYKHESISEKILRKLRKGQYNIDAMLDLHGMTVDQAKKATLDFLRACIHQDIRVALIIHGKGTHSKEPVLKNSLNKWLRNLDFVLAFCSAKIIHGSRGAVYVLLKHSTEEKYI